MAAKGVAQGEVRSIGVLVEASFQRSVRCRHVAVADGFGPFFAQIVLISQVCLYGKDLVSPCRVAENLQVVDPLIGQVDVAAGAVVVDVGQTHLHPVGIGKETAF